MPRRQRDSLLPAADRTLIEAVRDGLRAAADPAKAPQMQAYMKSAMPYYGVQTPQARHSPSRQSGVSSPWRPRRSSSARNP
ncbi:MAG: hypothetical protein CVU47_08265 [Chloroflexi bacterium HGW-Chloroflexi-9]|nr:MAG: hypothetical protein CVU47_08265 [Chloroflexi bacterium HGW-Chloroflexi-9]